MYNSYEHADKVLDGKFLPWAVPDLDKAGLVFLSNWEWGFRNLTNSKRPVNVPADVKGEGKNASRATHSGGDGSFRSSGGDDQF